MSGPGRNPSKPTRWLCRLLCAVALTLIIAVLAVFIFPSIDLQPTALRSVRSAQAVLGSLALAWVLVASLAVVVLLDGVAPIADARPAAPVLDLTCALLC